MKHSIPLKEKASNRTKKLKESFYLKDTTEVAQNLLGKKLVRMNEKGEKLSGLIVETEAYLGIRDPACHSYRNKKTFRTESLYLKGGHAYIYFIYGMYYCFNVVTRTEKEPEAVLIRSLRPLEGKEIMVQNRFKTNTSSLKWKSKISSRDLQQLTNGPGKLAQALNLTKDLNKESLLGSKIYIEKITKKEKLSYLKTDSIEKSPRVGLGLSTKEALFFPLRFFYKNNEFVSKPFFRKGV